MGYGRRNFIAYQRSGSSPPIQARSLASYRNRIILFAVVTSLYTAFLYRSGGAGSFLGTTPDARKGMAAMRAAGRRLSVATWNIAAINNNPFEYWITYDKTYEELMLNVENFIESPGDHDIPVHEVFTDDMFQKLNTQLTQTAGWPSVETYWNEDYKNRKIVSNFMKDPVLGKKRLVSMPDRVTNTINVDGSSDPVCRPTVINMYEGDLSSVEQWWSAWYDFMFQNPLKIKGKEGVEEKIPYTMLQPIKKSKYPDIGEQEEKDSLPLQTLCSAIFDAILVHMMNTVVSAPDVWQPLKRVMVEALNKQKVPHTVEILEKMYFDADIITLQEVSGSFIDHAVKGSAVLSANFHIVPPKNLDAVRDQNSVILLNKGSFPRGPLEEITDKIEKMFPQKTPVSHGDLLAVTTVSSNGVPFVVASFHGDTDGLATKPVLTAIVEAMKADKDLSKHLLVFGLDANTYEHPTPNKQQDVVDWGEHYAQYGLTSCWGDVPNPKNYTTYNARTYLQTQLNKACRQSEKRQKGDVNPKDFILFGKEFFEVVSTTKDNTGQRTYTEDMAFPTLQFPSDHGILSTVLEPKEPSATT